jgi:hypothetical protein
MPHSMQDQVVALVSDYAKRHPGVRGTMPGSLSMILDGPRTLGKSYRSDVRDFAFALSPCMA